jgi:hypothetical protein
LKEIDGQKHVGLYDNPLLEVVEQVFKTRENFDIRSYKSWIIQKNKEKNRRRLLDATEKAKY